MKTITSLFLGAVIIVQSCQSDSKLTDSEKETLVKEVMKTSQQFWSMAGQPYGTGSFRNFVKFLDENADNAWQTDPVASVDNITITKTMSQRINNWKTLIDRRISSDPKILESHFPVLSRDKVLEVNKGDFTVTR
jgi:cytochrome c556